MRKKTLRRTRCGHALSSSLLRHCARCLRSSLKKDWTGQLSVLERQVEEQRALARGHEQRSVAEAGRLQTMEKLLEKKDLERTSMMVRA